MAAPAQPGITPPSMPAAPVAHAASVGHSSPTQAASATASQSTPSSVQPTAATLASQPVSFESNGGQLPSPYAFDSRGPGYNLLLSATQAVLNLPAAAGNSAQPVTLSFVGANPDADIVPQDQLAFHTNYFGHGQTVTDLTNYSEIQVQGAYNGISLAYHGSAAGQLEYDVIVAPGADLSQVHMRYSGYASMRTDNAGNLLITTPQGTQLTEHAPALYQQAADGSRTPITGKFALNPDGTVGFAAGAYDAARPLVVDPTLDYSSYWGTSGQDTGVGVAVDGNGNAFIVGQTPSLQGSTTDTYVAKFNTAGTSLLYLTYLGSAGNANQAVPNALAVDPAGNAVVVGTAYATDYPTTTGAVQTTFSGTSAGFVTRLSANGDALLYSTFWADTTPYGVAVDALGQAFVTGTATSGMTTTTGAYQTTIGSGSTLGFVAAFSADGTSLLYSSYFGGTGFGMSVTAHAIAIDTADNAYVAGSTTSSSFHTTTGAYQTSYGGGTDAFLIKLNSAGSALGYATFLGGSGSDQANAVAVDRSGNAYATGTTFSTNFPTTTGAYQTASAGTNDAFVSKLNAAGSALVYSTYLGGSGQDTGYGIAVAPDSTVLVAGVTSSSNFPNVNPLTGTASGPSSQAFLSKLNSAGTALTYSTYLETSTSAGSTATAVVMDPSGNAFVTGNANGTFLTTAGAYQTSYGGGSSDAFVMKINASLEAPVITAIAPDNGSSSTDFITHTPNLSISGTSPPSITVRVYMDSVPLGTTTSNGSGAWSYDYTGTTLADGTYAFTARSESGTVVSPLSPTQLVTVDTTAPSVVVTVPVTNSLTPIVNVQASDLVGIPANATVTLDVDLNNDGNFTDSGESNCTTGTLVNGFVAIPVALSATGTYQVRARVTDTAGNQGTSSAVSFTIGTVSSPWTLTDAVVRTSATVDGNPDLQLGNLQVIHPLDLDQSPGADQSLNPALIYNSSLVNQQPIVQATLITDNAVSLPATITATLTWDGAAQSPVSFSTTGFAPGTLLTLAVQESTAITTTGRHDWSLSVSIPGHGTATASGTTCVVAEDSSPFGAGWGLSTWNQLISIPASGSDPAGWLWVYGDGTSQFFQGTSGTLTGPPENNTTLVVNGDGSLTDTAPDGSKIDFTSGGAQSDFVSADGKTSMTYSYTGGLLTGMVALDGGVATLTFSSGLLSTISAPGSRTYTMTMSSGDLTQIEDPDTRTQGFTYSSHRMTDATQGTLANHWAYNSAGLLTTLRWGNSSSPSTSTLASANGQGLGGFVAGSPTATLTDALGNKTISGMDDEGRLLSQRAADGGLSQWTRDSAGRVSTATDPLGNVTSFTRDSLGYVSTETFADSSTIHNTYQTAFHALLTSTDQNGHTTTYTYDSLGHLLTVSDAASEVTTNAYNSTTGLMTSAEDPMGRYTTYTYDSDRRVQTVTTQLGTTTLTYDSTTGEVATTTDPLSHVSTMAYDANGRMTSEQTADTYTQSWTYTTAGLPSTYTDKSGTVTATAYDSYGRGLVASTTAASGTAVAAVTLNTYDNAGRLVGVTDGLGNATQYALDPVGRTLTTTDPLGHTARDVYNLDGELTDALDPTGADTHYTYNNRGWVVTVTDAMGNVSTISYDSVGNRTAFQDARGYTTSYTFDAVNRMTAVTDPLNHTTTAAYWADGRVHSVTDALSNVTSTTYDFVNQQITTTAAYGTSLAATTTQNLNAAGNVTSIVDPLNHTTTYTLNAVGAVTAVTDPLSHTITYTLNAMGLTTAVTDPLSHTTTYTRNALGEVTAVTDATSRTTNDVLDANGNVVSTKNSGGNTSMAVFNGAGANNISQDADGNQVAEQFDAAGRMVAYTDPVGNTTVWSFDRNGNKIEEIDPNGATVTWTYNADNEVTGRTDQLGRSEAYSYDNADRLTQVLWKNSSGTTVNTIAYAYDADNRATSIGDINGTYTYTFDALGRTTHQTDIWSIGITFGYDLANNLTGEVDSLGGTVTNAYDAANRITEKQFTDTSSHALSIGYAYDNANRRTQESRYSDANETTQIGSTAYGYDNADRTTSITHKDASGTTIDELDYTYSSAGQVATASSSIGSSNTFSYDPTGQLTSDGTKNYSYDANGNRNSTGYSTGTDNELSTDGTWNYSYDNAGNETQKTNISTGEVWQYKYDNANHLTEADHKPSSGGSIDKSVTYKYDVNGNRIETTVDPDGTGLHDTITKYAYDLLGNPWADLDNSGALEVRHIYGDQIDALDARIDTSGVAWYLTDILGSVRDIAGSSGSLLDHRDYDVWGNVTNETHASYGDRYGWTGREFQAETNLQYNRARWYDPNKGQWLSQDPMGFDAGDSNLYRYVHNAPSNMVDPSGFFPGDITWGQQFDEKAHDNTIKAYAAKINVIAKRNALTQQDVKDYLTLKYQLWQYQAKAQLNTFVYGAKTDKNLINPQQRANQIIKFSDTFLNQAKTNWQKYMEKATADVFRQANDNPADMQKTFQQGMARAAGVWTTSANLYLDKQLNATYQKRYQSETTAAGIALLINNFDGFEVQLMKSIWGDKGFTKDWLQEQFNEVKARQKKAQQ